MLGERHYPFINSDNVTPGVGEVATDLELLKSSKIY